MNIYLCIFLMSFVTYSLRFFPFLILRKRLKNQFLISFLHYAPFVTLTVMVFPSILYSTSDVKTAIVGLVCAFTIAFFKANLILTVAGSCLSVYLAQLIL